MKRRMVLVGSLVLLVAVLAVIPASAHGESEAAAVIGAGQFELSDGTVIPFVYVAIKDGEGQVHGHFLQQQPGELFVGRVTCLSADPVNHRAWVGGVVTSSPETDPIFSVGADVWFRVVDYGKGTPDRSTVFGFKGAAGFDTSAQYCAGRPWPEGDARTWPVTRGNIEVVADREGD